MVADQRITVSNGKAVVSATGVLVGSTMFLDECVRVHMAATRSSLAESAYAASTAPAKLLGLSNKGVLARGSDADMTLLSQTGEVLATVVQGDVAFCCPTRW
jgi:N-acetylglucosamine-6-phosphate deacetylase